MIKRQPGRGWGWEEEALIPGGQAQRGGPRAVLAGFWPLGGEQAGHPAASCQWAGAFVSTARRGA